MRILLRIALVVTAAAASLAAPAASASDQLVVTCRIEYPTYASPSGWTPDVTGTCEATGTLHGPAILTVTAYTGPGCAAASQAAGWLIAADWSIEVSWVRVVDVAAVTVGTPAGWGVGSFTHDDPATVCGVHDGPATETAVLVLAPWTVPW